MITAKQKMYVSTENIPRSAVMDTSIGVRQDHMVRMLRKVGVDGSLGSVHALLLLDDTVILATSREMCKKKLDVVCQFCSESGMVINENKNQILCN